MKFIIRRSSIGARMRIKHRRGIASRWSAMLADVHALSRVWARSPLALAWRRRQRERVTTIVRTRPAAAGSAPESARTLENHRETWLTLTRLFERHISFESRPAISAAQRLPGPSVAARSIPLAGYAGTDTGPRPSLTKRTLADDVRPFGARSFAPAATGSLVSPPRVADSLSTGLVRETGGRNSESRLEPGKLRHVRHLRHVRQLRRFEADQPLQFQPAGARRASSPAQLRRPIGIVARGTIGELSPRRRLTSARAAIVSRGATSSSPPTATAAAIAMAVHSTPLVWRTTPPASPASANQPVRQMDRSATSDGMSFNQHVQGSAPSSTSMARATDVARTAMPPLSGPVMDRLAEDVMQRIERRIRIERERRGL
jgi:hypothetical protein